MDKQKEFWSVVKSLKKLGGAYPGLLLKEEQYDMLFDVIDEAFGNYEAGNFVKFCAALSRGTPDAVADGLLSLEKNRWDMEKFFGGVGGDRYACRVYESVRGFSWEKQTLVKEWSYNAPDFDPAREAFVQSHYAFLLPVQKERLAHLRPR